MFDTIVRKLFLLILSAATVVIPEILCAQTYYVAPNGDDNNPGTIEAPFATVQRAMTRQHSSRETGYTYEGGRITRVSKQFSRKLQIPITSL
jgi:hypothetical protein